MDSWKTKNDFKFKGESAVLCRELCPAIPYVAETGTDCFVVGYPGTKLRLLTQDFLSLEKFKRTTLKVVRLRSSRRSSTSRSTSKSRAPLGILSGKYCRSLRAHFRAPAERFCIISAQLSEEPLVDCFSPSLFLTKPSRDSLQSTLGETSELATTSPSRYLSRICHRVCSPSLDP